MEEQLFAHDFQKYVLFFSAGQAVISWVWIDEKISANIGRVNILLFIGPRYTWGPIFGSECLKQTTSLKIFCLKWLNLKKMGAKESSGDAITETLQLELFHCSTNLLLKNTNGIYSWLVND